MALVRQMLERRLPQMEAAQQRRAQQAALAGGGSSSCEAEALAVPGEEGGGEGGEERAAQQATIQVATVDSFQASSSVQCTARQVGLVHQDCLLLDAMVLRQKPSTFWPWRVGFQPRRAPSAMPSS